MTSYSPSPIPATLESNGLSPQFFCCGYWIGENIYLLEKQLDNFIWPTSVTTLTFEGSQLQTLDTMGAWLLYRTRHSLEQAGYHVEFHHFRQEHEKLLHLIEHYAPTLTTSKPTTGFIFEPLARLGQKTIQKFSQLINFLSFIGETVVILFQVFSSPSRFRWQAFFANLATAGINALPIIGLMAFLMGIVLAYQGGTQLNRYGANIFLVELVGITLLRELAPLLTAILVAGRSGSAYTAQIGTMHVTEEIDALRTLGIAPIEILVLPKLLALMILMPLLSAFADILGVFGGMLVAKFSFGVSFSDFLTRFPETVAVKHYLIGLSKAPIFAAIITIVGCYQGFQVQGSAESVGKQVTVSVVQAIFLVIIIDAFFSLIFNFLGI